ncbi:hypothetical protein EDB92DRAFT_118800 [Lactarius akahatsu]|uniref:Uncharacterized protein n=1 Tax=Lactarius akahatsu TaxID=416441 RepID=A0AAD4LPY3_9AGAM|nr:hypothetical protein EDB92DRAFT_118800 [Lactarius akahatsu]
MLERESRTGRGWIACTTDAVLLEKPQYYDLVIDLTSYASAECRAPGLQLAIKEPYARRPTYRLHCSLHLERPETMDRARPYILQLNADTNGVARAHRASALVCAWTDAWGVYEDVCVVCARSLRYMASSSTNGRRDQWSWAETPRERSGRHAHVREQGDGIEGPHDDDAGKYDSDSSGDGGEYEDGAVLVRGRQTRTTLALLQAFHAQTRFLFSRLTTVLPSTASALLDAQLARRDFLTIALGPLSNLHTRFVEWLAEEYAGGTRASVRRGWHDLLGGLVSSAVRR